MEKINKIFKGDRSTWIIFMLLCLVSLVEVYSATSTLAYKNANFWDPIVRHAKFLAIGFAAVLLLLNIPGKYFNIIISLLVLLLPVSIVLLAITMYKGVNINEAQRFLSIMGVQFQPSEVAKMACIVFVAYMFHLQNRISAHKIFWVTLVGVGMTCVLIMPENYSTAILLFSVCFLMMFVGQAPCKKMLMLSVFLLVSGGLSVFTLRSMSEEYAEKHLPGRLLTVKGRIDDFGKDKGEHKFTINDDNYQVSHAKIAIARGGIIGNMPGRSVQRDFLPQAYSDFIFAIIIEELGLLGGFLVMMLYVILMFRVGVIARRCEKLFPKYLALGCGLLIVAQALINMAVAVNLIPVTGQPLPLISRGGTSTVITCFYFGIILSVSRFGAGMGEGEDEPEEADALDETDSQEAVCVEAGDEAEQVCYADNNGGIGDDESVMEDC